MRLFSTLLVAGAVLCVLSLTLGSADARNAADRDRSPVELMSAEEKADLEMKLLRMPAAERKKYIHNTFYSHNQSKGHNSHSIEREQMLARVDKNLNDIQDDVAKIIDYVLNGAGKHQAYNQLAEFTDTIGNRISGSASHAKGVQYVLDLATNSGFDNVHGEDVTVPRWVRGNEWAQLKEPRVAGMNILGLGGSVGTNGSTITAPVLVVQSFDELNNQSAAGNTQGKIIVYNQQCDWSASPIECYDTTIGYRVSGAINAAKVGAVAALVRTLGSFSINSPHTGHMRYDPSTVQIPAACITIEDSEMLQRMQDRGQNITISLYMDAHTLPDGPSQNVVAEIVGSVYPDEVVLVSGHLDSWDVGVGAMDDGAGFFISFNVLNIIKALGLKPKRTIRAVGWSCEEFGGVGAQQYYQAHKANASLFSLVMESDLGVFKSLGTQFTGSKDATAIMQKIGQLLAPINATVVTDGADGTDITPWMQAGVPGASLLNDNQRYFWFHHSNGDTMSVLDPDEVDSGAITWAVTAYAVASLDDMLPR